MSNLNDAVIRAQVIAEWTAHWETVLPFNPRGVSSDYNLGSEFVEATPEADADLERRLREAGVII